MAAEDAYPPAQVEFVRKALDLERFAPLLDVALVGVDGIALKRIETAKARQRTSDPSS